MYRTILAIVVLTTTLAAQAAPAPAVYMTAASGTFTAYDPVSDTFVPASNWTNTENPGANLVGGYVNLGAVSMFFGLPMYLYTGDGSNSPYASGVLPPWGGPVPSATLDDAAQTIAADLSAFTWSWNVVNFGQGNANATGSWDPITGTYHLAWTSPFAEGYGFDGLIGHWTMTGVAAIPEPETYAQMLVALALMAPLSRRRLA